MARSKWAAFKGRGSRWSGGKIHVHSRDAQRTQLGDFESLCGTTYGIGTAQFFKAYWLCKSSIAVEELRCRKCLKQMEQLGWKDPVGRSQ